jgi:hypothetical protein
MPDDAQSLNDMLLSMGMEGMMTSQLMDHELLDPEWYPRNNIYVNRSRPSGMVHPDAPPEVKRVHELQNAPGIDPSVPYCDRRIYDDVHDGVMRTMDPYTGKTVYGMCNVKSMHQFKTPEAAINVASYLGSLGEARIRQLFANGSFQVFLGPTCLDYEGTDGARDRLATWYAGTGPSDLGAKATIEEGIATGAIKLNPGVHGSVFYEGGLVGAHGIWSNHACLSVLPVVGPPPEMYDAVRVKTPNLVDLDGSEIDCVGGKDLLIVLDCQSRSLQPASPLRGDDTIAATRATPANTQQSVRRSSKKAAKASNKAAKAEALAAAKYAVPHPEHSRPFGPSAAPPTGADAPADPADPADPVDPADPADPADPHERYRRAFAASNRERREAQREAQREARRQRFEAEVNAAHPNGASVEEYQRLRAAHDAREERELQERREKEMARRFAIKRQREAAAKTKAIKSAIYTPRGPSHVKRKNASKSPPTTDAADAADATAKETARKLKSIEEAEQHHLDLNEAERARVDAAEAKRELRRIGAEIGGA